MKYKLFILFIAIVLVIITQYKPYKGFAQTSLGDKSGNISEDTSKNTVQAGDIMFEEEVIKDPYQDCQDQAIQYFMKLEELINNLSSGKTGNYSLKPLSDCAITHLAGVYLYCSSVAGVCPLVLEAILEGDVVQAKLKGLNKSDGGLCPTLKVFWKIWVKNDMEKHLKYMIKTPHLNSVAEFNSKVRPKFLLCEDTVKTEIGESVTNDQYFRSRYKAGSRQQVIAGKIVTYLKQLKEKVPNVFVATGVKKKKNET